MREKKQSPISRSRLRVLFIIVVGLLGGWFSYKAVKWDGFITASDKKHILCLFETPAGEGHFTKTISADKIIEQCHVAVKISGRGEKPHLSLDGPGGAVFRGPVENGTRFGWGRNFPPNTPITISIDQSANHPGVTVIIADQDRIGITGWQVLSRAYVGLVVMSGMVALACRKSSNTKRRLLSLHVFKMFALAVVLIFFYLLFHEGGHALASYSFGGKGLSGSDFWGIHGHPHAGGMYQHFKPWHRAVTSFAGPALPTIAGWILFLWWRSHAGRKFREKHVGWDFYLSAINALLILPMAVLAVPQMMGYMSDGDWQNFINTVPGPRWLVNVLLSLSVLISVYMLWRMVSMIPRLPC